jgi:hypothetical protein
MSRIESRQRIGRVTGCSPGWAASSVRMTMIAATAAAASSAVGVPVVVICIDVLLHRLRFA